MYIELVALFAIGFFNGYITRHIDLFSMLYRTIKDTISRIIRFFIEDYIKDLIKEKIPENLGGLPEFYSGFITRNALDEYLNNETDDDENEPETKS